MNKNTIIGWYTAIRNNVSTKPKFMKAMISLNENNILVPGLYTVEDLVESDIEINQCAKLVVWSTPQQLSLKTLHKIIKFWDEQVELELVSSK